MRFFLSSPSRPIACRAHAADPVVLTSRPSPHLSKRPLVVLLFLLLTACTMHTNSFDSQLWKSQRGVALENNQRSGLTASLKEAVRVGMTREEVLTLLGPPDSTRESATDVYQIGRSPYGVDYDSYELTYRDGKLESLRHVQG